MNYLENKNISSPLIEALIINFNYRPLEAYQGFIYPYREEFAQVLEAFLNYTEDQTKDFTKFMHQFAKTHGWVKVGKYCNLLEALKIAKITQHGKHIAMSVQSRGYSFDKLDRDYILSEMEKCLYDPYLLSA